jgi:hypothetical protein
MATQQCHTSGPTMLQLMQFNQLLAWGVTVSTMQLNAK